MGNEAQAKYWNEAPGQKWVELQPDLDLMHAAVTDALLAEAGALTGARVLDIGTGAGASALAFAQAVGPRGAVLGVDISAPLIARAEQRARDVGLANLRFLVGDAAEADLGTGHDLAVSRFGTMFFSDPVAALRHIRGALHPGGRAIFAAWTQAAENPWFREPNRIAARHLGPLPPPAPGAPSPTAWGEIGAVIGLLAAAGWRAPAGRSLAVTLHHPGGPPAAAALVLRVGGVARALQAAQAGPESERAIAEDIAAWLADHAGPEGVGIPSRINLFTAIA